jgi:hypothetical protein
VRKALRPLLAAGLLIGFASSSVHTVGRPQQGQPDGAVKMEEVKYAALAEKVRSLKGKVVVVDVWGFF